MTRARPKPEVVLVGPSLTAHGGVAEFCRALVGAGSERMRHIALPSAAQQNFVQYAAHGLRALLRFTAAIAFKPRKVVHINPSFRRTALLRDTAVIWLSVIFRHRVLVSFHGWNTDLAPRVRQLRRWCLTRMALRRCHLITVLAARFSAELQAMGVDRERIALGRLPVDDNAFQSPSHRTKPFFKVLYLGRLTIEKGVVELIRAFPLIEDDTLRLVIAGDGPDRAHLEKIARESCVNADFLGHVSGAKKYAVLRESHAFVMPSPSEVLPIALLEAMASGLPVVTTLVGGIKDFFVEGQMGHAVSGTPESIAEALIRLRGSQHVTDAMSLHNKEYARSNFTLNAFRTFHLDHYAAMGQIDPDGTRD